MFVPAKPHLVSFCQGLSIRCLVITLLEKGVDFDIAYIDLFNKLEWLLKISSLGLVPILDIGGTVLFESAVINEYLDDVTPPSLHPKDPLKKARHRALIEFGSALFGDLSILATISDKEFYHERRLAVLSKLEKLGSECEAPFFAGGSLCLVDTAFAPALYRISLIKKHFSRDLLAGLPRVAAWTAALLQKESVRKSVCCLVR